MLERLRCLTWTKRINIMWETSSNGRGAKAREELGVSGNYITAEDRFTDDFIAQARLYKINNIVDLYVEH